jgi:hypothetical protein
VKWHQLHLSTLLAVMLLAGVLVWLNVRFIVITPIVQRGWPSSFEWWAAPGVYNYRWDWPALVLDVALCLLLLALAGAGIEWVTRRKKREVDAMTRPRL